MNMFEKIIFMLKQLSEKKFSIDRAISVLGSMKNRNDYVNIFFRKCHDALKNGYTLSSFMKLYFPDKKYDKYIYLIQCGEMCGNILFSLNLISSEINEKKKISRRFKNVLIYPMVVISITIILTVLIFRFCKNVFVFENFVYVKIFLAFIFLLFYFLSFIFVVKRFLTKSDEYIFFETLNLFLENKIDISCSLKYISSYLNEKNIFKKIYCELEAGEDLIFVLENNMKISEMDILILKTFSMVGELSKGIKSVYEGYKEVFENKNQIILNLIEPIMIVGVALYVVCVLIYLVLPILTNFGGVI